jgi:hypothetical protein
MNEELTGRVSSEKPVDEFEQIFWHFDRINLRRSCYASPEFLEPYVREVAGLVEQLYAEWLQARGLKKDDHGFSEYLFLVLPYISFRILNSRGSKPVSIFKVNSDQKKRFIDCMVEELHELPDTPIVRAMMKETLNMLLEFLESLRCRREQ